MSRTQQLIVPGTDLSRRGFCVGNVEKEPGINWEDKLTVCVTGSVCHSVCLFVSFLAYGEKKVWATRALYYIQDAQTS